MRLRVTAGGLYRDRAGRSGLTGGPAVGPVLADGPAIGPGLAGGIGPGLAGGIAPEPWLADTFHMQAMSFSCYEIPSNRTYANYIGRGAGD